MRHRGAEDRHQLALVARETAREEGRSDRQPEKDGIDRLEMVRLAPLRGGAHIG